ncbi:MAG: twin-arginine translocase TatA/TatE family subunit [Verrucomicrobiales bacterium]|jgi:TatA/E family protein of Tat protein translocase|nr:twin-arginine translocase TatA/TatE family subunit [Verrucomicrobiales bacterium]
MEKNSKVKPNHEWTRINTNKAKIFVSIRVDSWSKTIIAKPLTMIILPPMITPMLALNLPHGSDWIWILLIVVLLFGANKLPGLAKGIGKSIAEFKKAKDDVEREFNKALHEDDGKKQDKPAGTIASGQTYADNDKPKQS